MRHREPRAQSRALLRVTALLIALAAPLTAQEKTAGAAANGPLQYRVSATVTSYCPVERALTLHEVTFNFHNASCQQRSQVAERKTPTLPQSPLYRDVRISGYHFVDWSEGHPSPNSRQAAKIEISKTATTLSASGWLEPASCSKGPSGDNVVEDSFWRAKVVPEVKLLEEEQHLEPPVVAEIIAPKSSAVMTLHASCSGDREPSLQYSVTPIVNGAPQASIYTSPVLIVSKTGTENDAAAGAASIHSHWSPSSLTNQSEFTVTISGAAGATQ